MNNTLPSDEHFVLARRLRKLAAEITALADDLCHLPDDGRTAAPNAAKQHVLGLFLERRCQSTPGATVGSLDLYNAYRTWVAQAGTEPMSHKMFAILLEHRGILKHRSYTGKIYHGLALRKSESDEAIDGN